MARTPGKKHYAGYVKLRGKKLSNGMVSLYLDTYRNGERKYEFLKLYLTGDRRTDTESRQSAEAIRAQREVDVHSDQHGIPSPRRVKANFVDYVAKLAKEKSHSSWDSTLKHLSIFTKGTLPFDQVTPKRLEEFKRYLQGILSANTASLYFAKVKAALAQAEREDILTVNPATKVKGISTETSHRVTLTLEDLTSLATTSCPSPEVKRAFLFACYTGLRLSDVKALTWDQIRDDQITYRQQKTNKLEYMPLSAEAMRYAGKRRGKTDLVFQLGTDAGIRYSLLKWTRDSGVAKNVTFHTSRHTFATLALTHGADLYTVSKLLGHSKIQTTQIYAKVVDASKRKAVDLIPGV